MVWKLMLEVNALKCSKRKQKARFDEAGTQGVGGCEETSDN